MRLVGQNAQGGLVVPVMTEISRERGNAVNVQGALGIRNNNGINVTGRIDVALNTAGKTGTRNKGGLVISVPLVGC